MRRIGLRLGLLAVLVANGLAGDLPGGLVGAALRASPLDRLGGVGGGAVLAQQAGASAPSEQERRRTLADIRQDLAALSVELRRLRRELATTGPARVPSGAGGPLERLDALEAELRRLTARTEQLEHRIERIAEDGARRIGDLEFRLAEIAGDDLSGLGPVPPLGGDAPAGEDAGAAGMAQGVDGGNGAAAGEAGSAGAQVELAVGERRDFEAARAALEAGDAARAEELFAAFQEAYPGSPFEAEALLGLGRAREAQGDLRGAARAYLDSWSEYRHSAVAPEALLRLGKALAALGKTREACLTLGELPGRYPSANEVDAARAEMAALGCR